jgi:hypothetical protein
MPIAWRGFRAKRRFSPRATFPNIRSICGLEDSRATHALVMESVEGRPSPIASSKVLGQS